MSVVIDLLSRQHQQVLARIECDHEHFAEPGIAGKFLDFLECEVVSHFQLEEKLLFPELSRIPRIASGPLRVMEAEHSAFRDLLSKGKSARARADHHSLSAAATGLAALLQAHIAKEDRVLFPMALELLDQERLAVMDAGIEGTAAEGRDEATAPSHPRE
jgi:iron-sulfur cluster repair protein YtfE (RIC family)